MNELPIDLLLRYLEGALPEEARADLEQRVSVSEPLRRELEHVERLRTLARDTAFRQAEHTVRPFLAERVLWRLDSAGRAAEERFFDALSSLFRRVSYAGLVVVALLAAYNALHPNDYPSPRTPLEAVLSLPPATLEEAYDAEYIITP